MYVAVPTFDSLICIEPDRARDPAQPSLPPPPEAMHELEFCEFQVSVTLCPTT
jgi:hypothetical protein